MYKLSICIPTYNRAKQLANCLQSIIAIKNNSKLNFEVCVSDNCSTDDTEEVVRRAQKQMAIKYQKNESNLGIPRNFLNVIDMAEGEFAWLIGDDDLLLPTTIDKLYLIFNEHPHVDFLYINSFHLTTEFVFSFPQPFDTANLPNDMKPFSSFKTSGEMNFMDLVNPKISFDFLGGMFLSVFRRQNWISNVNVLDKEAISDLRTFSHFDNTFPHVKIFANAFANSRACFHADPLSVCLTGAREWAPMGPLVMSVRLVEALEEYKKNGLPYLRYLYCKNYALNNAIPDFGSMIYYKKTGLEYINLVRIVLNSCLYPNFYLSFFFFLHRKIKILASGILKNLKPPTKRLTD